MINDDPDYPTLSTPGTYAHFPSLLAEYAVSAYILICLPPLFPDADTHGRVPAWTSSLLVASIGGILSACAPTFTLLCIAATVAGTGVGGSLPVSATLAMETIATTSFVEEEEHHPVAPADQENTPLRSLRERDNIFRTRPENENENENQNQNQNGGEDGDGNEQNSVADASLSTPNQVQQRSPSQAQAYRASLLPALSSAFGAGGVLAALIAATVLPPLSCTSDSLSRRNATCTSSQNLGWRILLGTLAILVRP